MREISKKHHRSLVRAARRARNNPKRADERKMKHNERKVNSFYPRSDVEDELRNGQPAGHNWQKTRWRPSA